MDLRLGDASDIAVLEGLLLEAVNWSPDRKQPTLEGSSLVTSSFPQCGHYDTDGRPQLEGRLS